jgi:hexosaminidase
MKIGLPLLIIAFFALASCNSSSGELKIGVVAIIPKPVQQELGEGHFEINSKTSVAVENEEQAAIVNQLFEPFQKVAGWQPSVIIGKKGQIVFTTDQAIESEGYTLDVSPVKVQIEASSGAGFFYAMQSLIKLLPVDFYGNELQSDIRWALPALHIKDKPAFGWRGYMLDVSRHFFEVDEVKGVLDFMADSKLNRFHWHLTDDQGWRLEIKSYPKLTEIGAWRVDHNTIDETVSNWWGRPEQKENEKATYGGFYTQEEVKEIIAYAKERYIEVIPEIDLPGHAQSTIASYPEIGCVNSAPYVATGGVADFNTINPGKEETYVFAEKMLNELMDLFPFKYIHIGGDECNKNQWKIDPHAQQKIKEEGLLNEQELQSYFLKRIENMINDRGRIMIGWDEILEGGLAPNAAVMSWRGESGGIKSAKAGHDVVMTPNKYCYIDLKQGHDDLEPNLGYSQLLLSTSYGYKVIPDDLTQEQSKHILGIQANMWTESISDWGKLTYMTFPRIYAIAENGWTAQTNKNWDDFTDRLQIQFKKLEQQNIRYATSAFSPWIDHKGNGERIEIQMKTEVNNLAIRYTLDGTEPSLESNLYKDAFFIDKSAELKARAFHDSKAVGYMSSFVFPIHLASGVKAFDYHQKKQDLTSLTDLSYGKLSRSDKRWQLINEDAEIGMIFDKKIRVKELKFNSLRFTIAGVYPPEEIEVYGSVDGIKFEELGKLQQKKISHVQGRNKIESSITLKDSEVNEIKIKFKTLNPIPEGHRAAGKTSSILIDEIVVN